MTVVALQGIRGGTGVTSIAAGLAWALQQCGESVLVIDFSADNLLRLYFNMPFEQINGWARSSLDNLPWQDSIMTYTKGLSFLPYGKITDVERLKLLKEYEQNLVLCKKNILDLVAARRYDWIILDLPSEHLLLTECGIKLCDIVLLVLNPDVSCHARLHQQKRPEQCYFLMNKYASTSTLQKDLYQMWLQIVPDLLPLPIHHDETVAEALAMKKPLGEYCSYSLAAEEINALAKWCLTKNSEIAK